MSLDGLFPASAISLIAAVSLAGVSFAQDTPSADLKRPDGVPADQTMKVNATPAFHF